MVLEEGEGSLEKVAVEIFEREREGISEVVSWLLGLYLFVCREPPQSDSTLLSIDVYPLALVAIVFRRRALAYSHTNAPPDPTTTQSWECWTEKAYRVGSSTNGVITYSCLNRGTYHVQKSLPRLLP
jgi:hypothetical protein